MFEKILALDIGSTSVKMMTAKRGFNSYSVEKYTALSIDVSAEDRDAALVDSLSQLLEGINTSEYSIVTNVPMEKLILRNLVFPFTDSAKIREVLPFEAEEQLPFDLDDLILSFQKTRQTKSGDTEVLAGALPKKTAEKTAAIFEGLGIQPELFGLEANSLFSSIDQKSLAFKNYIQLDIGYSKTIAVFVKNGQMVGSRCINSGCGKIIQMIALTMKLSLADASSLFEALHLDLSSLDNNYNSNFFQSLKVSRKRLKEFFEYGESLFSDICSQVMLAGESFANAQHDDNADHIVVYADQSQGEAESSAQFERIFLSGGASQMVRISEFIGHVTAIPVSNPPQSSTLPDSASLARYSLCYGLVNEFGKRDEHANFLHNTLEKSAPSFDISKFLPAIFFTSVAILVLIVSLILNTLFTIRKNQEQGKILAKQFNVLFKQKVPEGKDAIAHAKSLLQSEKSKLQLLENVLPSDDKMINLIYSITAQLPEDETFVLKSMTISEKSITIIGNSESSTVIDEFKNKLAALGSFESVNLNTNATSKTGVKFTITIKQKQKTDSVKK